MPKLNWAALADGQKRHLLQRFKERPNKQDQQAHDASLIRLAAWVKSNPTVPAGQWQKDFGTFKLVGTGSTPQTFLSPDQTAIGEQV